MTNIKRLKGLNRLLSNYGVGGGNGEPSAPLLNEVSIPAGSFSSDGATYAQVSKGGRLIDVYQFSPINDESIYILIPPTKEITTANLTVTISAFSESDAASDNVVEWKAEAVFIGDGDEIDVAFGTAVNFTQTIADASVLNHVTSELLTAGNADSVDGSFYLKITRIGEAGLIDTLLQVVSVESITISINQ